MPFDPNRKFVNCVLCDGLPMSREHLFGESLARLLRVPINAVGTGRGPDGLPKRVNTGAPMLSAVSVCLCQDCNTSRFSAMMSRAQPVLVQLAEGQKRLITPAEVDDLLMYFERLGFLVDVLSSNYRLTDEYRATPHFAPHARWHEFPPVYSLLQRKAWLAGEPGAERPRVYVGRHAGVLGLNPETNVNRQPMFRPAAEDGTAAGWVGGGRQFHIVIGQLAVHIRMGEEVEDRVPSEAFVQLVAKEDPISWPAARNVDYDDVFRLFDQDPPTVHQRLIFRHPIHRILEEDRRRRQHYKMVRSAKLQEAAARKNSAKAATRKLAERNSRATRR